MFLAIRLLSVVISKPELPIGDNAVRWAETAAAPLLCILQEHITESPLHLNQFKYSRSFPFPKYKIQVKHTKMVPIKRGLNIYWGYWKHEFNSHDHQFLKKWIYVWLRKMFHVPPDSGKRGNFFYRVSTIIFWAKYSGVRLSRISNFCIWRRATEVYRTVAHP